MASLPHPAGAGLRWRDGEFESIALPAPGISVETPCDSFDSWLVSHGRAIALEKHHDRFLAGLPPAVRADGATFFSKISEVVPQQDRWCPRIQHTVDNVFTLFVDPAPVVSRPVLLATHQGEDPRTQPTVKGPDRAAMLAARDLARYRGADEPIILSPEGFVVEGATTSLLWWRGNTLCAPAGEFEKMASVTVNVVLALAEVLDVRVSWEAATPQELEGLEIWVLNSRHGVRIVDGWIDGPRTVEHPGRLETWRKRLDALTREAPSFPVS